MDITISPSIQNDSLQIGDIAFFVSTETVSGTSMEVNELTIAPQRIGKIIGINNNVLTIEQPVDNTPSLQDFVMFAKDRRVNDVSLLGYYAEVKISNRSHFPAELFSIGSEVAPSSK